ncbi:TetR family transcriptional regulator [Streptomyces sp. NPDC088387]|uniref:TetR family transcriptional regulator n=1 Tax=Streptomyces sp. NPDC088387 TaxID=3365859 RepID=UPI0038246978
MESPGRREQNKQKTRKAIEDAASRLFDEHGFANTTVRDIAQAAGVGERTFFRYFPTKESLVAGQVRELIPRLTRLLLDRPADEPPYTALLHAVLELGAQYDVPPAVFITGPPARLGPETDRFLLFDLEKAVTDALCQRLTLSAPDEDHARIRLRAAVKARAGVAAIRALFAVRADLGETGRTIGGLSGLVREAFEALDGP